MDKAINEPSTIHRKCSWNDTREWLALVDAIGELRTVHGASSEEDIGAITEMFEHTDGSPAALFDEIPGFATGYRVLSNSMGTACRQAITLGIDPAVGRTHHGLLSYWRKLLDDFALLPPRLVPTGPVLENILSGDAVDLCRFPAPIWHPRDGGRYIGTASVNIMRDPDTGIINAGTYRNQLFDRNSMGISAYPPHHGGIIREKYLKRGERCPIVTVVGADPLIFMSACVEGIPFGQSELDWAGGVRGAPIDVIQGELTGLPIPAHAEIALEGFITPDDVHSEGPYGEWMGFYQGHGRTGAPVVRVKRIYHRNNPILLGCPQGKPPHEDNQFLAYLRSGLIWNQLERAGVPGIVDVWAPPEGGNRLLTVVAIRPQYAGHAKQAGLIASQCAGGLENNRMTVVVEDYVDITDMRDVLWAILTRCDPVRDVDIIAGTKGSGIDMAIAPEERRQGVNSRMYIDATTPFEWRNDPRAGDVICTPERTQAIFERWGWLLEGTSTNSARKE